jgi:hypothetical protein
MLPDESSSKSSKHFLRDCNYSTPKAIYLDFPWPMSHFLLLNSVFSIKSFCWYLSYSSSNKSSSDSSCISIVLCVFISVSIVLTKASPSDFIRPRSFEVFSLLSFSFSSCLFLSVP